MFRTARDIAREVTMFRAEQRGRGMVCSARNIVAPSHLCSARNIALAHNPPRGSKETLPSAGWKARSALGKPLHPGTKGAMIDRLP